MDGEQARVRPKWAALSIILAAGLVAGLLPFLLYIQFPYLASFYFVYAAIVVPWRGRGFISHATERPGLLEWLLAGWNAVGVSATASMIGFFWYGLSYVVVWTVGYGAQALGWALEINPTSIATYVSAAFIAIFALAIPFQLANELPLKLYPEIAGTRSAFFPVAGKPWRLAMLALFGVAGGVASVTLLDLDVHGLGFTLSLTWFLLLTGAPLLHLGKRKRPSASTVEVLTALRKIFSAAGYKLIERPRTDSPELDPLITSVDLLALARDRGYAVNAKVLDSRETDVGRSTVFEVRTGAKALQRALRSSDTPETVVEPYLLVVGGQINEGFRTFSGELGVKLVHLPDIESLRPALAETTDTALRDIALHLLQVPAGGPMISPGDPSRGVTG
jgi:hypothetical protein